MSTKFKIHAVMIPLFIAIAAIFIFKPILFLILLFSGVCLAGVIVAYCILFDVIRDHYESKEHIAEIEKMQKEANKRWEELHGRVMQDPNDPVKTDA